jgi:hypothetical protein
MAAVQGAFRGGMSQRGQTFLGHCCDTPVEVHAHFDNVPKRSDPFGTSETFHATHLIARLETR